MHTEVNGGKTSDKPLSLIRRRWVMRGKNGWQAIPPRTDWGRPVAFNSSAWSTLASARRVAAEGVTVGIVVGGEVIPVDLCGPAAAGRGK